MIQCIAHNTETRLRKLIHGEVKCFAHGNRIYCDIKTRYFSHRITVQYTMAEVLGGYATSARTTATIIRLYQKFLNELFFKY